MTNFSLKRKTGFKVKDPNYPVVILDDQHNIFYDTTKILPVKKFNIPPGEYFLSKGELERLFTTVQYDLAILPIAERLLYPDPSGFEIVYGETPHKCNVLWNEKKILFDMACLSLPKYTQYFMLFHEFGHQHYDTEEFCDLFASNSMLKYGFTPYQIQLAKNILSDRAQERKDYLDYVILKQNGQKK
jgi:hypothetical protein